MKVLLSGLGPDEFMGGYHHAGYRYFADLLRCGKIGDFAGEIKHFAGSSPKEVVSNMGKILLSASMKESTIYKLESQFYHFEPFNKDFVNTAHKEAGAPMMDKLADLGASKLNSFMLNMVDCGMLKTQLHYEDRMSMGTVWKVECPSWITVWWTLYLPCRRIIRTVRHIAKHCIARLWDTACPPRW